MALVVIPKAPSDGKLNGFGEVMTDNEKKAAEGAVVGLIYPPPEVRNIVDKTAAFVAKNGIEFLSKIAAERQGHPKFKFLQSEDPYHVYFQHKIRLISEGKIDENEPSAAPLNAPAEVKQSTLPDLVSRIVLKDEPPVTEFTIDTPTIGRADVEIVKLTAQFVARNGRSFLQSVIKREQGNYQFEFLRPHHHLFHYFTTMVDQYIKVLLPTKEIKEKLATESADPHQVIHSVRYATAWEKQTQLKKEAKKELEEKDRLAYQAVDWHDFLLVDTIQFDDGDVDLPPPVKMEDLGARLHEMEKIEHAQKEKERVKPTGQTDTMDVEMDLSDSEDEVVEEAAPAVVPQQPQPNTAPVVVAPPLEPEPEPVEEEIKIRKYNPKNVVSSIKSSDDGKSFISPLTGEMILSENFAEHMRIGLLDPKWREQKDRLESEMSKIKESHTIGSKMAFDNLQDIASRRTDIFGSIENEVDIGQKAGEKSSQKMTWDGVTQSAAIVQKLQQQKIQAELKNLPKPKQKIGPAPPRVTSAPKTTAPPNTGTHLRPGQSLPPGMRPPSFPPGMMPHPPGVRQPPPPQIPGPPSGRPPLRPTPGATPPGTGLNRAPLISNPHLPPSGPPGMAVPPPPSQPRPTFTPPVPVAKPTPTPTARPMAMPVVPVRPSPVKRAPPPSVEEPAQKRPRADGLLPEEDFVKSNPMAFTLFMMVPVIAGKYDDKCKGQRLSLSVKLTDKVSEVKARVQAETGMPPGKQTIKIVKGGNTITLNNVKSLAFYNMTVASEALLTEKARGGKRN
eukprot:m.76693 g.76693  ORF g.76693 m.76693 type:complete len:785 (+) comp24925_c0_seq1:200-2554(+)